MNQIDSNDNNNSRPLNLQMPTMPGLILPSMPKKGGLNLGLGLVPKPREQIAPSPEFYTNSESS